MKNTLMLLIVLAGLATAIYRFLPADIQAQANAQLNKIAQIKNLVPEAEANPPPKKYVLDIPDTSSTTPGAKGIDLVSAFMQHQHGVQVAGEGEVIKVLFDDNEGSRHQRFILRTNENFTILIAHNIDLAHRVNNLKEGDTVSFYGEYEWNEKGGVVHWTHRDPRGHHVAGWIKHNGVTYQ